MQDLVGEDVLGWKDSSDDSYDELSGDEGGEEWEDAESDFHVEVEDVNAKRDGPQRGRSRPRELAAEAKEDDRNSITRSSRRRKSRGGLMREKLAISPNEAAPIGMLANLSLRKSRSRKSSRSRSVSTVGSNDYGVANGHYVRVILLLRATSTSPFSALATSFRCLRVLHTRSTVDHQPTSISLSDAPCTSLPSSPSKYHLGMFQRAPYLCIP